MSSSPTDDLFVGQPYHLTSPRARLLGELGESPLPGARYVYAFIADRLDAIEAAAVAEERARLRAAVEGLHQATRDYYGAGPDEFVGLNAAAVLALIAEPATEAGKP